MTQEQQAQVDRLVTNAKAMKQHELDAFIANVKSGDGSVELKQAILNGITDFQEARSKAEVEMSEQLKGDEI